MVYLSSVTKDNEVVNLFTLNVNSKDDRPNKDDFYTNIYSSYFAANYLP